MATASWADLPADLILRLLPRFPCLADRVQVSCLNRHWRAVLKPDEEVETEPPKPELPWLLFPSTTDPSFYTTIGGERYGLTRLPPDVRAARFCGSHGGGWLALALASPPHAHALYNLNSGVRIDLPRVCDDGRPVTVSVAAFSASPSRPPPEACLVGAIIKRSPPCVAFWQRGMAHWHCAGSPITGASRESLEDIVYLHHKGAFHVVTSSERVVVYAPQLSDDGQLSHVDRTWSRGELDLQKTFAYETERGGWIDHYLVESRDSRGDELLMVMRFVFHTMRTQMFLVYRINLDVKEPNDDEEETYEVDDEGHILPRVYWGENLECFDDRMLFVGHGCSRSFEVVQFEGFKDSGSTIHFYDDRLVAAGTVMGEVRYDLTDMGKFDVAADDMVANWPPENLRLPDASDRAPPIWWLH
ncbi:hypothetical protein ACP4OV_025838 [Aristida adscensionis]